MERLTDEYCKKIFAVLGMDDEKVRFNELHRNLKLNGVKMSTPTLIQHLNHLVEKGIILREEKDKQNVSYIVNWKEYLEAQEFKKTMEKMSISEKNFKTDSLKNQVSYAYGMLTLGELFFTRMSILDIVEPEKKLQHHMSYNLVQLVSSVYYSWLVDTCKESEEKSKKALEFLGERIVAIQKAFSS
jgi:DNA-binding HxlR family transcriptional regulator